MYALKQNPPLQSPPLQETRMQEMRTLQDMPIEAATRRLHAAIDALTDALERRKDADRHQEALMAQLHAMGNDRSRLATELDEAQARAGEVAEMGQEIVRRLDVAMTTVRDVLATHGG